MSKRSIFEDVGETAPAAQKAAPGAAEKAKARARAAVRGWLWTLLAMVALMVVVGGLTRLTDSGLAITEWNVIVGALPPLSDADWRAAFDAYKTTDEFRLQNAQMTLAAFKPLFWWEWGHRFLGRLIGLAWAIPLVFFAVRGMIPRGWGLRLVLIGVLGGLQGAIGWWMVWSGLADRVDVAPYRLMTHLGLAFLIFALIAWFILRLGRPDWETLQARRRRVAGLTGWAGAATGVIFAQILLGALVAGTDGWAGWNTWPLMDGAVIAPAATEFAPFWSNFFENPAMTQFVHRTGAYVVLIVAALFALKGRRSGLRAMRFWSGALLLGVLAQAAWGIVTLVLAAPLHAAIVHQLGALGLLALAVRAAHEAAYPAAQSVRG